VDTYFKLFDVFITTGTGGEANNGWAWLAFELELLEGFMG